jgi:2-keto-4-pentenoate hydratase
LIEFIQSRQKTLTIRAGQIITTGAFTGMMPVDKGDTYAIEFDKLGTVQASFE